MGKSTAGFYTTQFAMENMLIEWCKLLYYQ